MVVSMFCTGFASWLVNEPYSRDGVGAMTAYVAEKRTISHYGLNITPSDTNTGLTAKKFSYSTITVGSGAPTYQYTNTALTMLITVDETKIGAEGYRDEVLVINCRASNSNTANVSSFGDSYTYSQGGTTITAQGIGYYLTNPSSCKLTLNGYPNLYLTAGVELLDSGELQISIPLEQIYNLVALDKVATTSVLVLEMEFTSTGKSPDTNNLPYTSYIFTGRLQAKGN